MTDAVCWLCLLGMLKGVNVDDKVTVWVAGIQVVSEREILIGSSDSAQIRISHLPANVAVVKKNAGEWFL